jgi:hypothetical protein
MSGTQSTTTTSMLTPAVSWTLMWTWMTDRKREESMRILHFGAADSRPFRMPGKRICSGCHFVRICGSKSYRFFRCRPESDLFSCLPVIYSYCQGSAGDNGEMPVQHCTLFCRSRCIVYNQQRKADIPLIPDTDFMRRRWP